MKTKLINFFKKFFQSNWDMVALLGIGTWIIIILVAFIYGIVA